MLKEFREFAIRGNVMDLAVAVIIGGAFGKIITSLVNDVLMPVIGLLMGGVNFSELSITVGAAVIKWVWQKCDHALRPGIDSLPSRKS